MKGINQDTRGYRRRSWRRSPNSHRDVAKTCSTIISYLCKETLNNECQWKTMSEVILKISVGRDRQRGLLNKWKGIFH